MKFKKPSFFILALLSFSFSYAQFRLPVGTSSIRGDVQKVVATYPEQFASIRGEVIEKNPQTTEYASLLTLDKSENCSITQYSSNGKPIYSWQAVMLSTEDFEEAAKKYKWLFTQLKGLNVKYVIDQYTLVGKMEQPTEERKFTTSTLTLDHPPTPLRNLKIEVSMQFEFPEWKVALTVFEKERDDEDQGNVDDY